MSAFIRQFVNQVTFITSDFEPDVDRLNFTSRDYVLLNRFWLLYLVSIHNSKEKANPDKQLTIWISAFARFLSELSGTG